jgi:hypothetical protein
MATYTHTSSRPGIHPAGSSGEVKLSRRSLYRLNPRRGSLLLKAVSGTLWVTLANDPHDYFLRPGENLPVSGRGTVLVEALSDACVHVS